MIPWLSAYTDSSAASACGTATGRDRGSGTAGRSIPKDVGQLTMVRLAVAGPALVDGVVVLGLVGPVVGGAGDADPVLTADVPQPAVKVKAAASSAAAIGERRSQPR